MILIYYTYDEIAQLEILTWDIDLFSHCLYITRLLVAVTIFFIFDISVYNSLVFYNSDVTQNFVVSSHLKTSSKNTVITNYCVCIGKLVTLHVLFGNWYDQLCLSSISNCE